MLQEINHAIINNTMTNFVKQTEIMPVQFNEQCKIIKHTGILAAETSFEREGSFCLTQQQREGYLE